MYEGDTIIRRYRLRLLLAAFINRALFWGAVEHPLFF